MKNYERYADKIRAYEGTNFCDDFIRPHILKSSDCRGMNCAACRMLQMTWLLEEYKEPEVDWSKVKVDTPILVRSNEYEVWSKRYFAEYKDGKVYAWNGGRTSWTSEYRAAWKYVKLAESEEE